MACYRKGRKQEQEVTADKIEGKRKHEWVKQGEHGPKLLGVTISY